MTRATTMSPFRLFGRTAHDERALDDGPDPWLDDPAPVAAPRPAAPSSPAGVLPTAPPPGGSPVAPDADGPATAAARPAVWTPRRPPQEPVAEPEPVTDPFGFPPVPPPGSGTGPVSDDVAAAWAAWAPAAVAAPPAGPVVAPAGDRAAAAPAPETPVPARATDTPVPAPAGSAPATPDPGPVAGTPATTPIPAPASPTPGPATTGPASAPGPAPVDFPGPTRPSPGAGPGIDPAEASALAGAFAADLLSWDEDDPARRGRVLATHLPATAADGLLGWTGTGRQRADLVLPGRVRVEGDRAVVDVRVRVVPYRRVDARGTAAPEPEPDDPIGTPAGAPAPAARGWRGLAARWVRLEVGLVLDGDELVVDAGPVAEPARRPSPADLDRGGAR